AQDRAGGRLDALLRQVAVNEDATLLAADKDSAIAEEAGGGGGRAKRERANLIGHGGDAVGVARSEAGVAHCAATQAWKPSRINCSGRSRPMNTRRLSRRSPSCQRRW